MTSRPTPRRLLAATLMAIAGLVGLAAAPAGGPVPVLPGDLHWFSPPTNPAVRAAWVLGREEQSGPYILRVELAAGGRIPPHIHPDERNSTVLSRTIYVGFGAIFDEAKVVAVPVGGVYVAPAGVPHYVWAKDGAAVYQETGVGPTATVPVTR